MSVIASKVQLFEFGVAIVSTFGVPAVPPYGITNTESPTTGDELGM